jgi:hypothetical protein
MNELDLNPEKLVVELASNDGYLLKFFQEMGTQVLGIEPAANVAAIAESLRVPTIVEFFGVTAAKEIIEEFGYPSLVVANNVFAHIPDMQDFTEGMAILCNDETVITIENPSFTVLLAEGFFDTIYHEHYSYLTCHSVRALANKYGLEVFRVDELTTHGGSNRYWLSRSRKPEESVFETLEKEKQVGLFEQEKWADFSMKAQGRIEELRQWFRSRKTENHFVVGYGAAHKGNTFLNSVGEASRTLQYVVDASPEKQGKFLPGSQVPVFAPDKLVADPPTDVLILPWNIADELATKVKGYAPAARIWVAHPSVHRIA